MTVIALISAVYTIHTKFLKRQQENTRWRKILYENGVRALERKVTFSHDKVNILADISLRFSLC